MDQFRPTADIRSTQVSEGPPASRSRPGPARPAPAQRPVVPTSFFRLRARKCSATCAGSTFSSSTRFRFSMVSISSRSFLNLFFHKKSNLQ